MPALLRRHDGVAGSVHHGDRRVQRSQLISQRKPVFEEELHRKIPVMNLPDRREVDERRAQHEPRGPVLGREFYDHRGTKTLAVESRRSLGTPASSTRNRYATRASRARPSSLGLPGLPP